MDRITNLATTAAELAQQPDIEGEKVLIECIILGVPRNSQGHGTTIRVMPLPAINGKEEGISLDPKTSVILIQ